VREKLNASLLSRTLSDVMRRDLATLRPDQTVRDALRLFRERRFSTYPLVTAEGTLAGVLAREDLFDFLKRGDVDNSTTLDRVNRMNLPVCLESQTVERALEQMVRAGRYKCLVTDGEKRLLGIVAVLDLLGEAAVDLEPA